MHLRSLTLKGFKSFPDRTRLEFGAGVSVIIGPNGCGKSNVTDAVLWAMGEQSPLAVRGQSMQDVIFGGGRGVQARGAAEVELVLDNSDGTVDLPVGEVSILRRLDRGSGEGEYRLNGARCRLVDILEVLSDTGLGKEMHSVVSQGRVEAIVTSKPRDRRLLVEEAAGLGKHRKRRRRAQLKLVRTQDNLDRALDVEREARSRLRPLKRQAEAAELHERLERQTVEARWELARDAARARRAELAVVSEAAAAARVAREEAEAALTEVGARREAAEEALARRTEQREAFAQRVYGARSAAERVELRLERTRSTAEDLVASVTAREHRLKALRAEAAVDAPDEKGRERIAALEAELARLDAEHQQQLARELRALEDERARAAADVEARRADVDVRRSALAAADEAAEAARRARAQAERAVEAGRREAARVGAELAACNQFLRTHAGTRSRRGEALAEGLEVDPGTERAVAAALDGLLGAVLAEDLAEAVALLDACGPDGGRVLLVGDREPQPGAARQAPAPGARRLSELVRGSQRAASVARRLLADAWLVERLEDVVPTFRGTAVTAGGRVYGGDHGELRQSAEGGEERVLAERNRREQLIAASGDAVSAEHAARGGAEAAQAAVAGADAARETTDRALREADRALSAAQEELRRIGWLIDQRHRAPQDGAAAVRRAEVHGELLAERRVADRAGREREHRARSIALLGERLGADRALAPQAERLASALAAAAAAIAERLAVLEGDLAADRTAGDSVAARLRACAAEEADIQRRLRERGDALTAAEVRAQQARDAAAETDHELVELARRLALPAEPAEEALDEREADALRARIERLARRREQLGPVNPLAKAEYDEALAYVGELEHQRTDLETALRELRSVIRETDRQIRETFDETFAAAARHFAELAGVLFPGGRGRLRLVEEDSGPRPVLGDAAPAGERDPESEADDGPVNEDAGPGVEIEITPAGKSMKRLSLLSGGEKSMTAIAFLFAVFLARPCPFYILDEVEAALDDHNITRFLDLLRRHAGSAQFIVVTHQKRTMEAADTLYGVSMGDDGVSKVISRRLPREATAA